MAKYDVFNEDGVPHRLTAHENGTNVFLEARKCIRRLMAKEGLPVDEYDLRIKFPGKTVYIERAMNGGSNIE